MRGSWRWSHNQVTFLASQGLAAGAQTLLEPRAFTGFPLCIVPQVPASHLHSKFLCSDVRWPYTKVSGQWRGILGASNTLPITAECPPISLPTDKSPAWLTSVTCLHSQKWVSWKIWKLFLVLFYPFLLHKQFFLLQPLSWHFQRCKYLAGLNGICAVQTKSLQLCLTLCDPWTAAHQAPLSMGFSRQEYWSGLPCPAPEHLPNLRIEPMSLTPPALAGRFFITSAPWEASSILNCCTKHLYLPV